MRQITVRLPEEMIDDLEAEAEAEGVSRSEYIRDVLDSRDDGAEDRVAELEEEVERLKREKRLVLKEREEKRELAKFAEDQRTAEQRRREAGLATRARWFLFGEDRDDE